MCREKSHKTAAAAKSLQSCLTLCDPIDIRLSADFSAEIVGQRVWHDTVMKGKSLQPRALTWQGSHSKLMEKSKFYR